MFLRGKKQEVTLKQPRDKEQEKPNKPKALGGWEDDEDDKPNKQTDKVDNSEPAGNNEEYRYDAPSETSKTAKPDEFRLYTADELSQMLNLEYENKLVEEITQPGGIRVKPNESLLVEFCKAAKTLDVPTMASLLISRLQLDVPYAIKAKSLYTMEYISKKNEKYNAYFKKHMSHIKNQPMPSDNQQQYENIFNDIVTSILGEQKSSKELGNDILEFTDPGYNVPVKLPEPTEKPILGLLPKASDKQAKPNKAPSKQFLSPEELKKKKLQQSKKANEPTVELINEQPKKTEQKLDILGFQGLTLESNPAPTPPPPANQTVPSITGMNLYANVPGFNNGMQMPYQPNMPYAMYAMQPAYNNVAAQPQYMPYTFGVPQAQPQQPITGSNLYSGLNLK